MAVVVVQAGEKVKLIQEEEFSTIAYHLGRRDQRREDRARLERSNISPYWRAKVLEALDGE